MMTRIAAMMFAVLFVSLSAVGTAWAQESVSDPVPLLNGTEKAKLLYSLPYVRSSATVATCVSCTSTAKTGPISELVALELFADGSTEGDLTLGEGVADLDFGGDSETICTRAADSVPSASFVSTDAEANDGGTGRIVATTNKVICTAFMVPVVGDPPGFMTILPLYKGSKQKGGM